MKTSKGTEKAIRRLEKRYHRLEVSIVSECAGYIAKAGKVTDEADWLIGRMVESGARMGRIKDALQKEAGLSPKEIDKIFTNAAKDASLQNAGLYKAQGKKQIPVAENLQLQQLTRATAVQTLTTFENITRTAGFIVKDPKTGKKKALPLHQVFTDYLDTAALQVIHGYKTPDAAMSECINALTGSGVRTIDYASGRSDRIDTAVRRAIMTGTNQITAQVQEQDAMLLRTDKFEVEWHEGARPTHQPWQGKVWTKEQLHTVCGLGTAGGLCGVNCYHTYYPFIEGISKRLYTDAQLRKMTAKENTPKVYSPTGMTYTVYEAKQEQRHLELRLRVLAERVECLKAAGATKEAIQKAETRYAAYASTYEHFSHEMNLPEEWERVLMRLPKNKRF